jgi:hypothetical protein
LVFRPVSNSSAAPILSAKPLGTLKWQTLPFAQGFSLFFREFLRIATIAAVSLFTARAVSF